MKVEGSYEIDAGINEVWKALNDPDILAKMIPGATALEQISENSYKASMNVGVGMVKGNFEGTVDLVDPTSPETSADGNDTGSRLAADVLAAGNITLTADLGYIGAFGNELDIDSRRSGSDGVVTVTSRENTFLIEQAGDMWLNTVEVTQSNPLLATADERVASLTIAIFSVGVAIGSVVINTLLKGRISAKYAPASVIAMGVFVTAFWAESHRFAPAPNSGLYAVSDFLTHPQSVLIMITLAAIAITGGMFVVPLFAFLTTTVTKDQTARTVAANNVVNSGAMVIGSLLVIGLSLLGVGNTDMLLMVAVMCLISAWIAQKLHRACD